MAIELNKNYTILYSFCIQKYISVFIPRKNGKGYLKSPFGGHHCNDRYFEFLSLNIEYAGDCFDIDGYLAIGFALLEGTEDYEVGIKQIMNGLLKVFPYCTDYKEVNKKDFYQILKIPI